MTVKARETTPESGESAHFFFSVVSLYRRFSCLVAVSRLLCAMEPRSPPRDVALLFFFQSSLPSTSATSLEPRIRRERSAFVYFGGFTGGGGERPKRPTPLRMFW